MSKLLKLTWLHEKAPTIKMQNGTRFYHLHMQPLKITLAMIRESNPVRVRISYLQNVHSAVTHGGWGQERPIT